MAATERHIESQGPDSDSADFISRAGQAGWDHRENIFNLTKTFLDSDNPALVAGALEVLYRLRTYRPTEWIGWRSFEEVNADYLSALDDVVVSHVQHAIALNNFDVFRNLALYLGVTRVPGAHDALRKLVALAPSNEQVAICLAWHRDPSDMELLLPIMLGDSPGAASLPYHFRNSYGRAAIPYLQRARFAARGRFTRENATTELQILEPTPAN